MIRGDRRGFFAAAVSFALIAVTAVVQPACARQDAPAGSAHELYRTGHYDQAIRQLEDADSHDERRLLVRSLLEVGRYADAVDAALNGSTPAAVDEALANVAGEALYAVGRRDEAEALFARAEGASDDDAIEARLNHALALWRRGARAEALQELDGFIDMYNDGRARTASELTAVATAVSYLGVTDPQLFHDAVRAFEEAAALDETYAEPKLREGELFLDKYNSTDASALFREVLAINPRHPRALLGLARAKAFDGTDEAMALVDSSLAINPASPDARAFRSTLLLGLEDYDGAKAEAERGLQANPASREALAALGAVHYLQGDRRGYDDAKRQALALDPTYSGFDVLVAEMAAQQRRYREAVDLARAALALDSTDWSAHALIGLTELRLGDVDAARSHLDLAFAGDPYNVWVKNTLDLLDTYPQYVTRGTDRFELFLHGDEADVIELYMRDLAEEAYTELTRRYGAEPELPIRVEVYPRHADFSVRSVGLAGLGALGVAFGNILALDSPAARTAGTFNWGSTLWHEIAHAVTLEASGNRVPRWLTEGLSVLEERRARPGWGEDAGIGFLVALKQDRILDVSELNNGFVRPTYPEQIMHAYYQASLVAELIESEHGANALRDMLRAYRDGRTTEEVFRGVLGTELAQFDHTFANHLRDRFSTQLAAIDVGREGTPVGGSFMQSLADAHRLLEAGRFDDAERAAERAIELIPEYAAADGPYRVLRAIELERGDTAAAAAALMRHIGWNETDYDAHLELAALLEAAGDDAGAADALERAMFIHPYDPAVHDRMARLYESVGDLDAVVRERRALVALDPVDRAQALYALAVALEAAGDTADARRQVLRALEIAPGYVDAQELLLRLTGAP